MRSRRTVGNGVLFVLSLQHALIAYLIGLLTMALYLTHRPRFEGLGILSLSLRDWISRRWGGKNPDGTEDEGFFDYSVTVLRCIFWNESREIPTNEAEERDTEHEGHERDHLDLFEDMCAQGFWHGLTIASILWLTGWCHQAWQPALVGEFIWLLYPIFLGVNWKTALLRYGLASKVKLGAAKKERTWWQRVFDTAYLQSGHERRARAINAHVGNGKTWAQREAERM